MTDQEWLDQTAGQADISRYETNLEREYPREAEAAAYWGLHPHEARPRSGHTFLHERREFLRQAARQEAYCKRLLEALKAVVAVADRKTDVFDEAHAVIAEAQSSIPGPAAPFPATNPPTDGLAGVPAS